MCPASTRTKGRNLVFAVRKRTKNMASFPVWGGIRAALSSVAEARLSLIPLCHSLFSACQWSQGSCRSPAHRGGSLRTQNFGTTKFRPFVRVEAGHIGLTRDILLQLSPPHAYNYIVTIQQTWHFLYKLLYFIESYSVLYNNYGHSHADFLLIMILAVMKIAGFGRTLMETLSLKVLL